MTYLSPIEILVDRIKSNSDATLSVISVDGEVICFGLEDEYREHKVPAETRIQSGTYNVTLRQFGGFHKRYSNSRYKQIRDIHQGMLEIQEVPKFTDILIHCGNTDEHTEGCLLVGEGGSMADELTLLNSINGYCRFYPLVVEAAKAGVLTITFRDSDLEQGTLL